MSMQIRSKFWLEDKDGETVFGEGRRKMLELIDDLGSMQATAKALGMSYRGVWARIKATEERLGIKLVETSVGRGKNRGSRLTPEARNLLINFKKLTEKGISHADQLFGSIFEEQPAPEDEVTPTIAVIGPEKSGKKSFVSELLKEWSLRERRVGIIDLTSKHLPEDRGGSWLDSGAKVVINSQGNKMTLHLSEHKGLTPEVVGANYALGCSLVLVLAEQRLHLPTVELFRQNLLSAPLTRRTKDVIAMVGDPPKDKKNWPFFKEDQIPDLVDLIENKIKPTPANVNVQLTVNGKRIPMLPFIQNILKNTTMGMIGSLKSCENPYSIELNIED
jgi:molybdate transport system regulatory protein